MSRKFTGTQLSSKSDVLENREPSKDLPWWVTNIDHMINSEVQRFFEEYSGIPSENVHEHVYVIREKAWSIKPWPCTGMGLFLSSTISHLPIYPTIIDHIKAGASFIDVGCYMGTDLRFLVKNECPQENLYGTDLIDHWGLGFELFKDQEKFHAKYLLGDILEPDAKLKELEGNMDFISATHLLHNWDWATQVRACCNLSKLSRLGTMIIGYQVGTVNPEMAKWNKQGEENGAKLHTPETFQEMWKEVEERTGTKWECKAVIKEWEDLGQRGEVRQYIGDSAKLLEFVVTRVA